MAIASFTADVERIVTSEDAFTADVIRYVFVEVSFVADASRLLPIDAESVFKSLTVTLAQKTVADSFSAETVQDLAMDAPVQGSLMGLDYLFLVQERSKRKGVQTIVGRYSVEDLLFTPIKYAYSTATIQAFNTWAGEQLGYTPINYSVPDTASAGYHAHAIASALGKSLALAIDDFVPSADLSGVGLTFRNLISNVFGWTDRVPRRQINVFIRGGTLHVLQRGKESGTVEITTNYTEPTISDKKVRTSLSPGTEGDKGLAFSFTAEPMPFTGTIGWGEATTTYSAGLIVAETHLVDGFTEQTTYGWAGEYMTSKRTVGKDNTIETMMTYGGPGGRYLVEEVETTTPNGGGTPSVRRTKYFAVGHGWWETVVEVDGQTISKTLSHGAKGGKASRYSEEQANRSMGASYHVDSGDEGLEGQAIVDTNFPVSDEATTNALTAELKWMNGAKEERVNTTVWGYSVIDFTKRVIFRGNTYYLERNVLTKNAHELKQALDLVRWYK